MKPEQPQRPEQTIGQLSELYLGLEQNISNIVHTIETYERLAEQMTSLLQDAENAIAQAVALKTFAQEMQIPEDQKAIDDLKRQVANNQSGVEFLINKMRRFISVEQFEFINQRLKDAQEARENIRTLLIQYGVPAQEIDRRDLDEV